MKPLDDDDEHNDDAAWLEALAGRLPTGADPATVAEAESLRRAQQRFAATSTAVGEDLVPPLRLPARRACGLCRRLRAAWRDLPQRWRWPGLALAASLALMAIAPLLRQPAPTEEPVLRGSLVVQRLHDPAPLARRERIAALLEGGGVAVRRYERFGRMGLDAQLDAAQRLRLAEPMAREGLAVDAGGALNVEIEPEAPR